MRRIILIVLLAGILVEMSGCVFEVRNPYPVVSDVYVSGAYQHGGTYIGGSYWNYPGYGYQGFPGPICGWNTSGLPLGCNAGPVAPSYLRDIGVLPRPYPYLPGFYPYR
jgi:hypothetical protein